MLCMYALQEEALYFGCKATFRAQGYSYPNINRRPGQGSKPRPSLSLAKITYTVYNN